MESDYKILLHEMEMEAEYNSSKQFYLVAPDDKTYQYLLSITKKLKNVYITTQELARKISKNNRRNAQDYPLILSNITSLPKDNATTALRIHELRSSVYPEKSTVL